jgi:demethoxyubiquinone hydroxylase (CLK1/Coq7/Cat5 family)
VLIKILQDAHAGELAAAYAYRAHWRSLWRHPDQRAEVRRIEGTEWHHRGLVANQLEELGAAPRRTRELGMAIVGRFFGSLCFVSGWFAPMYAAGRLEAMNVGQYLDAHTAATALGLTTFLDDLEAMRVEEVRHEQWFGDQCRGHWLLPLATKFGGWAPPEAVELPTPAER